METKESYLNSENEEIIASMWNNYKNLFFLLNKILQENQNVPHPQGTVGSAKINVLVINAK